MTVQKVNIMDFTVTEKRLENGTMIRYAKTTFQHPEMPGRVLNWVQFQPGSAWIMEESALGYLEELGFDEVAVQTLWPKFCWAKIEFNGNMGVYTSRVETFEDVIASVHEQYARLQEPPKFLNVIAKLRAQRRAALWSEAPYFWRLILGFLG